MRDALVALALAVCEVGATGAVVMAVVDRLREEGLQGCGEETYYNCEEEEEDASEQLAARGVGEIGRVPVSQSGTVVSLETWCTTTTDGAAPKKESKPSESVGVAAMFSAIKEAGRLALSSSTKPTRTARVIPKSSVKCSLIYNGIPANSADSHRPKGFYVPRFEGFPGPHPDLFIWPTWTLVPASPAALMAYLSCVGG